MVRSMECFCGKDRNRAGCEQGKHVTHEAASGASLGFASRIPVEAENCFGAEPECETHPRNLGRALRPIE